MVVLQQEVCGGDFSYKSSHLLELCRTVALLSSPSPFQVCRSLLLSACVPPFPLPAAVVGGLTQGEPFVEKLGGNLLDLPRGRLQQFSAHWKMAARVWRDIRRSAGEPNVWSRGLFLRFRILRNTSDPSLCDFSMSCLALRTALSASPFDWGNSGLLVV